MDKMKQLEIIRDVAETLQGLGIEVNFKQEGGMEVLMALVPVSDDDQTVLMEIVVVQLTEEYWALQFYSTIIVGIETGYETIKRALSDINFYCIVGSFGIFKAVENLFHKYAIVFNEDTVVDEIGVRALEAFETIQETLIAYRPLIERMAFDGIEYDKLVAEGYLREQPKPAE